MWEQRPFLNKVCTTTVLHRWHFSNYMVCFINAHITCSFVALIMSLAPIQGMSLNSTVIPNNLSEVNVSEVAENFTKPSTNISSANSTRSCQPAAVDKESQPVAVDKESKPVMERTVSDGSDVPRDSPKALVIASSIAAVSILVFFVLAYLWHTHQLDSRARKLAIRLALDSEREMECHARELQVSRTFTRPSSRAAAPRCISESSQEQNQYIALTPDEDKGTGSDCGPSSVAVSENEAGDTDDVFEPIQLPPISERGRVGIRGGRGSHRKWSRSRKASSGANLDKRDSAVTDKEILSHFASRRHSTFFI